MHCLKRVIITLMLMALPSFIFNDIAAIASERDKDEKMEYKSEIKLGRNEKWWGLFITDTPMQPFTEPFEVNTADYSKSEVVSSILISDDGRYIWSEHPIRVKFDGETITVISNHNKVEVERAGRTLRNAYIVCCHKNFPPKNTPPNVDFFTKPIYETKLELGHAQGEGELFHYASKIISGGLPTGIIVICDGWQSRSNPLSFDSELYPNPKKMIDAMHEMGFKVMLTITPYLSTSGRLYRNALSERDLLYDDSGNPAIFESGEHYYMASYDMGDPILTETYAEGIEKLSKLGIDGFRFDCGESLKLIKDEGQKEKFIKNWLTLGDGHEMCEYQLLENRPLAPYLSYIRLDTEYNHSGVEKAINTMVAAGMAGFPCSYVDNSVERLLYLPEDETALASLLQFSIAMPVSRVMFAPWRIEDEKLYNSVAETLHGVGELNDYIGELLTTGGHIAEPILRHMEYQFPKMGFADCHDQFMLGAKYLVAPSLDSKPKRMVRLPKGTWIDKQGKQYRGPQVIEVDNSDGGIVWFELKGR